MKTQSFQSEMQKVCEWRLEKHWHWLSCCINGHPENVPLILHGSLRWDGMPKHKLLSPWGPFRALSLVWSEGWWHFLFCHPAGYSGQDFDWADYQKQCGAEAAPHLCFRNVSFLFAFALLLLVHVKHSCLHEKAAANLWEVPPDLHESVLGKKLENCFRSPSLKKKKTFSCSCLYLINLDFVLFVSSLILCST